MAAHGILGAVCRAGGGRDEEDEEDEGVAGVQGLEQRRRRDETARVRDAIVEVVKHASKMKAA
ncbi:hypothetical protein E4U54_005882 [Claviceps lovelessii]|nr:hypothetical protein E4U54_005882 [Claviceps lovelessii]